MAIPEHLKKRSMDAISHPETQAQARVLRGAGLEKAVPTSTTPALPEHGGLDVLNVKRMAMHAIKNVETVAQVGVVRLTGGIGLYLAHIRQMDQQAKRQRPRDTFPREITTARHTYNRD